MAECGYPDCTATLSRNNTCGYCRRHRQIAERVWRTFKSRVANVWVKDQPPRPEAKGVVRGCRTRVAADTRRQAVQLLWDMRRASRV